VKKSPLPTAAGVAGRLPASAAALSAALAAASAAATFRSTATAATPTAASAAASAAALGRATPAATAATAPAPPVCASSELGRELCVGTGLVARHILEEALEARAAGAVARDGVSAPVQFCQPGLHFRGREVVVPSGLDAVVQPGGDGEPRQPLVELGLGEGVAGMVDGESVVCNLLGPRARLVDGVRLVTVWVVGGEYLLVLGILGLEREGQPVVATEAPGGGKAAEQITRPRELGVVKAVGVASDLSWKRTRRPAGGAGEAGAAQVPGRTQERVVIAAVAVARAVGLGDLGMAKGGRTAGTGCAGRRWLRAGRSSRGGSRGTTGCGGTPANRRLRRMALLGSQRRH